MAKKFKIFATNNAFYRKLATASLNPYLNEVPRACGSGFVDGRVHFSRVTG